MSAIWALSSKLSQIKLPAPARLWLAAEAEAKAIVQKAQAEAADIVATAITESRQTKEAAEYG